MRVLIVGAGPAGVTTGYLLARRGVEVHLLERETDSARVFRGEALMPLGIDALEQMGLGQVLATLPQRVVEAWEIYLAGRQAFRVPEPQAELGAHTPRVVSQPAFLEAVLAEAQKYPSFSFLPGVAVRQLLQENGRVTGVQAEGPAGMQEMSADLVIGCDGRGSVVRTRAELELKLLPENYDVLWFKMPAPPAQGERCAVMIFASVKYTGLAYTSWDGRLQFALLLPKGEFQTRSGAEWAAELAEPVPPSLGEHIRAVHQEFEGPVRLNVIVGRCPRWTTPGLLLIGDAAHPMSPVRAQGINLAFRDAIVTANHLVPPLLAGATPQALDDAARAVQTEREPEIVRAQTLQLREARGQTSPRLRRWLIPVARVLAPLLGRFRWAQRLWLHKQHDLRFGSVPVKLRV